MPTRTFVATPSPEISPGVSGIESRSAAVTRTSSRSRATWFGCAPSTESKTSDEVGVGDPGAVETVPRLTFLILTDLRERDVVDGRVFSRRDEGGHSTHRV